MFGLLGDEDDKVDMFGHYHASENLCEWEILLDFRERGCNDLTERGLDRCRRIVVVTGGAGNVREWRNTWSGVYCDEVYAAVMVVVPGCATASIRDKRALEMGWKYCIHLGAIIG